MDNIIRILLVDDEEALRNALTGELTEEGYKVETADDGDTAIAILQEKKFEIVLLDIRMPRMSGMEVLRFIKEKTPATKVVVLTAVTDLKTAMEAKRYGAEDYVEKPYILDDLLFKLRQLAK